MSATITLHLWWLWVYVGIGFASAPTLAWLAWKHTSPRVRPWWKPHRWYVIPATIVLWPLAWWEELR